MDFFHKTSERCIKRLLAGDTLKPTTFRYEDYLDQLLISGYTPNPIKGIGRPPYLGEGVYCFDSLEGCWKYNPTDDDTYSAVVKIKCADTQTYDLDNKETLEDLFIFLKKDFIHSLECRNFDEETIESYKVLNSVFLIFLCNIIDEEVVNVDDEKVVFSIILYLQRALFAEKYDYNIACRKFGGEEYKYYVIVNSDIIRELSYSYGKESVFKQLKTVRGT